MSGSIFYLFASLIVLQLGWPPSFALEVSYDDLPNFKKLTECESAALCIKVTYANGEEDMITADEFHGERHAKHDVYKGRLASTNAKVVVILKDESHDKDLVVFKCKKAHSCHNFRVDLEGSGEAVCSVAPPNLDNAGEKDMLTGDDDDMLTDEDMRVLNRDAEQMKMDPLGYKIRVWVYYDDRWKKRFGEEADTRADAVMALVDEMFSEETLQTQLHFTVESVKHVPGSGTWGAYGVNKEGIRNIAAENSLKPNGPDLNVFLTGTGSGGGTAWLSSICKKGHTKLKSSVTGWAYDDEYTAEIVAHEIGHNLGMYHDFSEGWGDVNKTTGFRQREEGVDCRGYMDYSSKTDGWSACSVHDFTYRFNKFKTGFCLPQVNLGKECLAQCNDKSGLCEGFCGTKNYCCKKGETENGCDGKDGGEDSHVCVLEPLGDSCLAASGENCVFPFKGSKTKLGSYTFCPKYRGSSWCATSVDKNGKYKTWDYCIRGECQNKDPYCTDPEDCRAAFEDLGYKAGGLGYEYEGDYSVHGCYGYKTGKYAGHFFYGTGGTYGNESRLTNLELPEFRIPC